VNFKLMELFIHVQSFNLEFDFPNNCHLEELFLVRNNVMDKTRSIAMTEGG